MRIHKHKRKGVRKVKKIIENVRLDEERALYGSKNILVRNASFDGPADGESAVKSASAIYAILSGTFTDLKLPIRK